METERPLRLLAIRKLFWEKYPDILNAFALITIVCYTSIVLLYEIYLPFEDSAPFWWYKDKFLLPFLS